MTKETKSKPKKAKPYTLPQVEKIREHSMNRANSVLESSDEYLDDIYKQTDAAIDESLNGLELKTLINDEKVSYARSETRWNKCVFSFQIKGLDTILESLYNTRDKLKKQMRATGRRQITLLRELAVKMLMSNERVTLEEVKTIEYNYELEYDDMKLEYKEFADKSLKNFQKIIE